MLLRMLFIHHRICVENLLDRKNKGLYEFVRQSLKLSLKETNEPYYGILTKGNTAEIHIPYGKASPSSFAHELLHAELKIKGVHFSTKLSVSERPLLVPIFSENLSDHITNVLEHRKMYPKFISMGYYEEEFLADSHISILDPQKASSLVAKLKDGKGRYYPKGIGLFIGHYLAVICSCFSFFNYEKELQFLKTSEPSLTSILDALVARWDEYDIEKEGDQLVDSSLLISYDFLNEVEEWVKTIATY